MTGAAARNTKQFVLKPCVAAPPFNGLPMRISLQNLFAILLVTSILIGTAGLAAESIKALSR
jgi:hypothetical protein